MNSTRRNFIRTASVLAAGSVLSIDTLAKARIGASPADKIRVGLIGANSQGYSDLASFLKNPGVECVALCDVDRNVLNKRTDDLVKLNAPKPRLYVDYRKMLENKDIDIVIVGTPDHWHCLQFVDSLEAGKHVYVEKPIGNSIAEINIMQKAAKKHGKMVQVGQWQRSQPHFVDAINYLKTGKLGRIRTCKAWSYVDWKLPFKCLILPFPKEWIITSGWVRLRNVHSTRTAFILPGAGTGNTARTDDRLGFHRDYISRDGKHRLSDAIGVIRL
jgi:hypothetical protein